MRRVALAAALVAPFLSLGAAPAVAATGQVTLVCYLKTDTWWQAYYYDTGVTMQIDVPKSVKPGQTVSLSGRLTLQFDEALRQASEGYVDQIEGRSDTVSVRLGINGRTTQLFADRWQTGKQPIRNPMVVSAPISFPAFVVPENATGAVTIDLPQNDVAPNTLAESPKTVAVTGESYASGPVINQAYEMECYRRDNGVGRIASIPVTSTAAGSAAPSTTGGSAAAAAPGASTGSTAGLPAPGDEVAAAADPFAAAPSAAGATGGTSPTSQLLPTDDGASVPGWSLLLLGVLACIGAVGHAAWTHVSLRAARSD